jgi:large subunit ribosomal protein L21
MTIYAVMKTGGKEYRVAQGDVVRVEKLAAAPGAIVEIREVSSIETGQGVTVGAPTVVDARVIAEVIEEGDGEKILIFKKKRRNHYQMMTGDLQSYTALRIREIAVGQNVYAAAAPRRDVAAAATPPPPRISKPERKVAQPQAKKPPKPPMPTAPPPPAPIELVPAMAAQADAPLSPRVASEELVGTQPQALEPSRDAVHPVQPVESPPSAPSSSETTPARFAPPRRVEIAAPAPAFAERGARKRRHGIAALVAGLLVITAGLVVWGSREPRAPAEVAVEVVTVAAPAQAAQPSVPPPAAKAPPRKELAVKKTAAASAPSAPVQPPE